MNLRKKKELAARILKVGKERIIFSQQRLNEIKEAITKQDIRDLKRDGAITVREISGRRKNDRLATPNLSMLCLPFTSILDPIPGAEIAMTLPSYLEWVMVIQIRL